MKLTNIQCKQAQPSEKAYKLTDGDGLYLEITPTGAKYWRFQYRINGKRPRIAIGVYPEISLLDAREKRAEYRKLIKNGIDPNLKRKQERLRQNISSANSLELIARAWYTNNLAAWTPAHGTDFLQRFEKDVFPKIGAFPVTDLAAPNILSVIRDIEARGANELARRALQNIGRVYRYAIATGRAERDPTYKLTEALKPMRQGHYSALEANELPEFIKALRMNKARLFLHTVYATELLLMTFVRTGELIQAKWAEFDFDEKIWRIPAKRMKMRRAHIVPLSTQVSSRLMELKTLSAGRDYVFPHYSDPRKHMSNNTILKAIRMLGFEGRTTGHVFRALAMSTIKEKLGYHHEAIDRQLAHQPRSKVDRAYDRAEFLDERTQMMQDWANYIDACYKEALLRGV